MEWINSQPWIRPVLGVLVALSQAVIQMGPKDHSTVVVTVAGWVLTVVGGLGAASLGQSSSKLTPSTAKAVISLAASEAITPIVAKP